jgi:type VI secretion system protein ImpH
MADQNRMAPHSLTEAFPQPQEADFFQFLRWVECRYAEKPRLGTALSVADEPLRLGQDPALDFAPSTVSSLTLGEEGRPLRLGVRFMGMFGPNGALPLHLTEYARGRIHHHGDETFARFADIFHHRLLSLFYRAWANARPTVSFDRPDSDRFAFYAACLFGLGLPSFRGRDAMPDRAKLFLSGLLSCQAKHAEGLAALIRVFFDVNVAIHEFVGEWMEIPEPDRFRLGVSPDLGALGQSAVIGARVWGCQHKFRIVLGPMSLAEYRTMLPGQPSLVELVAIVRNYLGDELVWSTNLILRTQEVPPLVLDGGAQLGWTTWLGERTGKDDADDVLLNPFFRGSANNVYQ